jgi:hypothetical protein
MRIKEAGRILPQERDHALDLHGNWPLPPIGTEWEVAQGDRASDKYLFRELEATLAEGKKLALREASVRFPSAPVYGINRKREFQYELDRMNYHTVRILRNRSDDKKPAKRVYLFHNGLNELDSLGFHYQLAAYLLSSDPLAACVIRPFPGHLTRSPFPQDYAERPLDRYLQDPTVLFREFIRYMLETQWFLSMVVPRSDYRVVAGLDLLHRSDEDGLVGAIHSSWKKAYDESCDAKRGVPIDTEGVRSTVRILKKLLIDCERTSDSAGTAPSEPKSLQPYLLICIVLDIVSGVFSRSVLSSLGLLLSAVAPPSAQAAR